jgi:hypothetical protein
LAAFEDETVANAASAKASDFGEYLLITINMGTPGADPDVIIAIVAGNDPSTIPRILLRPEMKLRSAVAL